MRALLDMDGVVADFVLGAMQLHNKSWPYNDVQGDDGWNLDLVWGMKPCEFWDPMGFEFWEGLQKTRDADAIVELLRLMVGHDICFLSSPCFTLGCMEGKRAWASRFYPEIPVLFSCQSMSAGAAPPKWFCAGQETVLIDDSNANVTSFRKAGGKAVLVPRPWNHLHRLSEESVLATKMTLSAMVGRM